MVDDAKSVRRNKKIAGIEDPIVIVQRLLNVYRQLHILDEKQREEFDRMVLQQPPEIRHMCSTLPGGSLLQEYVDELEEKYGVAPDQNIGSEQTESGKENILANALADTPSNETAVSAPATATASENQDIQKQMLQMMQAMQKQTPNVSAGAATIKADSGFAKEIASAISGALAISDEKRRKETAELTKSLTDSQLEMTKTLVEELGKHSNAPAPAPAVISEGGVRVIDNTAEITKAITESQLEMAKMFLQHNAISASNSNANNANNIQINNAPLPNSQELIGDIIKAQSQLFREMAKEQTKELSTIISAALRESHQLSNKTLVNTLTAFQKENMKFFKQQAKNQTVVYQQVPIQTGSAVPVSEPVYQYIQEEQENSSTSAEPSYIKKVFGNMFNRMHNQQETETVTELSSAANEPEQVEYEYIEVPAETISEQGTPVTGETEELAADAQISATEQEIVSPAFENDNIATAEIIEPEVSEDGLDLSNITSAEKKKKKKKKKKKGLSADNPTPSQTASLSNADKEISELLDFSDIAPSQTTDEAPYANGLDISLFDSEIPEEAETLELSQTESTEANDDNFTAGELSLSIAEELPNEDFTDNESEQILPDFNEQSDVFETLTSPDDAAINLQESEPETLPIGPEDESTGDENKNSTDIFVLDEDYSAENSGLNKIQHSSLIPDLTDKETAENLFNSANDYNEIPQSPDLETDYKISLDTNDENVSDNENGKWEYEEVPESEDDNAAEIQTTAAENEDGEWEWEYEEVPEGEDDNAAEIQTAADESEDGEWEWEYEEVPEGEDDNAAEIQTAADESEDGEWEWEYEEIPEGEDNNAAEIQTAADESEDGEWEWEYEEIPEGEDNNAAEIQTAADESEDGEWEWEYEEVPEGEDDNATEIQTAAAESEDGEWEWEYEEVPEGEDDNAAEIQTAADESEDGEWEWEYEEVPEEQSNSGIESKSENIDLSSETVDNVNLPEKDDTLPELSEPEDVDFSDLFNEFDQKNDEKENFAADPYSGSDDLPDDELGMASLQSGDLYFQDEISASTEKKQASFSSIPDIGNETAIPDWSEEENKNEPYHLNSDLKP